MSYSDTERRWGVLDARVCLPAVLNDPRKTSRSANEPVPVIPPSTLPEIQLCDFSSYLRKLKHRNQDQTSIQLENQAQKVLNGSSITSKIPSRFYQNDFDTRKEIQLALSAGKDAKTENICVHDAQLKHWLDLTEVELSRRLSSRAASFLAAVSAQDTLKERDSQHKMFRPGVLIRTKFIGLSDRRPSRGQKFYLCPTESRAEIVRLSEKRSARIAAFFGHFSTWVRTVRQPNFRESKDLLETKFIYLQWFLQKLLSVEPSIQTFSTKASILKCFYSNWNFW